MIKKLLVTLCVLTATNAFGGMVDNYGTGAKATALGGAFSAMADDPFAVYYNPAGLTGIERRMVSAGTLVVTPDMEVNDYTVHGGIAKDPVSKRDPKDPRLQTPSDFNSKSTPLVAPHLGVALPITDRFSFGVAAYAPWGMEVNWSKDLSKNPGAYISYHAYYRRVVITPSLAYKISDRLSVGAGVSLGKSETGNRYKTTYPHPLMFQKKLKAELEDDFNYSFNAGIMYAPTEKLTLGLTYRGRTETDFEGDLTAEGIGKIATVDLEYDHPEQVQGGIRYTPDDAGKISLEMDMVWTNWSINKNQREVVTSTDPRIPLTSTINIPRNWKDTKQFRFGAQWQVKEYLALRTGYIFDPSPIPDNSMDFVWPDEDKRTYSVGAGLELGNFIIDTAVTYTKTNHRRRINGESQSLNNGYKDQISKDPGSVSFNAEGTVWCGGVTVSYLF